VATVLRSDARQNRAAILEAARELFAEVGVDASPRALAQRAGVGVGTLYRHFPTREQLLAAVLDDSFAAYVAAAEQALDAPDGWTGFTSFLETALSLHARNRALAAVADREQQRRQLAPVVERLIERAQAEGSLRRDFDRDDLSLLFWSLDRAIELTREVAPDAWRRQLAFVLDGLHCANARR
jgi:AcrR family transcriptional regulator